MFKIFFVIASLAILSCSAAPKAKPGILAAAPLVAAPAAIVTAQSSQVIARNYNALAAPIVTARYVAAAPSASLVAAPYVAASYPATYVSPYLSSHTILV